MATQSAELLNILDFRNPSPSMANTVSNLRLDLVKDSYSGKYYGNDTYANMKAMLNQATNLYQSQIKENSYGFAPTSPYMSMGGLVDPIGDAQKGLATLSAFQLPEESDYIQKPMMIESFKANTDGWNKYFESSYKTPRIAEDNLALAQRQAQGNAPGTQLVSSNLAIRSESGTGVGRETIGLNPFGKLDAGLNI
jgi:hypothetical protein